MKIVLSGGGTGGHIYPLFAVAEQIINICNERGEAIPQMYFYSDKNYYPSLMSHYGISYSHVFAGKVRTYSSIENVKDMFLTFFGIFATLFKMMATYPDIVFAKGGYASFPVLLAARILNIPVIIHESDTVPGRVTFWAAKFAYRVAVNFPRSFSTRETAHLACTGQPIMSDLIPILNYKKEYSNSRPVLLVTGGSQGSQTINSLILLCLPQLLEKYSILHIVGDDNLDTMKINADRLLENMPHRENYVLYGHVNLSEVYPHVDVAISRGGATTMFELALWQIPTVFIPLAISYNNHQAENAYEAVKAGWAKSLEENNLSSHMLLQALDSLTDDKDTYMQYSQNAEHFGNRDAAHVIAKEILTVLSSH